MSVFTTKTGVSSILKPFSTADRERAKTAALNKVRFVIPKEKGLINSIRTALDGNDFHLVREFTFYLNEADLCDEEVITIMQDARKLVHELNPSFSELVDALISLPWKKRSTAALQAYSEFCTDVMIAHNTYIHKGIPKLIVHWIPSDQEATEWRNGTPSERIRDDLRIVHGIVNRILKAVPLAFDVVMDTIQAKFPYIKKPPHVTAGYLHNVLWFMEYMPVFEEMILGLVLQKLLTLDVNAPRDAIAELSEETDDEDDRMDGDGIFEMDDMPSAQPKPPKSVEHPIGQSLDICLLKLYEFVDAKCRPSPNSSEEQRCNKNRFFKTLVDNFEEVLLPSHDIHHVQFVIFYVCSLRQAYADAFLATLWQKVRNPSVSATVRHTTMCYIASFLARAKFVPLSTITFYLKEFCNWAHRYIDDSDEYSQNGSLRANEVFFSICQAIFYLITFRARDLTANPKDLLFLQTLQLSRLAMCHLNPLRYCLATLATAFAGVTRTHQLAYCHTVLERNARRKLATVFTHDNVMPEETLDTFFPFDPYVLKLSNKYIEPNYLVYKMHEMDKKVDDAIELMRRKRGDSEMLEEDDFILADKRQKIELSKSQEFDRQFHYGTSPGFHKL